MNLIDTIVDVAKDLEARPSWDEYFMATAFLIATRSACQRLNVGCVIVSKGTHKNRIIAAGYNGFLPGAPHISRVDNDHEQSTVHAEQNAISDAENGVPFCYCLCPHTIVSSTVVVAGRDCSEAC